MLESLFGWLKASRCKNFIKRVQCRLKLLKSKRETIVRQLREDVVKLLKNGQDDSIFTWVEQLFKNQSLLAAYDLLDHYCEFIIINLPYIRRRRDCPNDIGEAVSSLIFASTRCGDLPELKKLRKPFGERYGNDFVVSAEELCLGNHVNQQIIEKLCVRSVSDNAKLKLIEEIAKDHNLQLKYEEIKDRWNAQYQQVHFNRESVHDPSVQNSDCDLEKQFSDGDIEVVFRDIRRAQVKYSNDKEKLHSHQQRHFGRTHLLREKAKSYISSYFKKTMPSSCQSHNGSESLEISSSMGVVAVRKHTSDEVRPLNSFRIHTSMQEVGELNELDPSYERTFVYLDDGQDNHFSLLDYDEDSDEEWLASMNLLQSYKCSKQCEEKHIPESRSNRSKDGTGITGTHGEEEYESGYLVCKSPLRASRASLSGLCCCNCAQMLREFGQVHDGSVSCTNFSKSRKSVRASSRKRSISMKNELHDDYPDTNESGHLCGISQRLSRKIHHQQDCSSIAVGLNMKDMAYAMHSDESCGVSDVNFQKLKQKTSHFNRAKPDIDYFSQGHFHQHQHSADRMHMRSGLCREKYQKEMMLRNMRKYDGIHDCCLGHPCYFFAFDSKIDWEILPLNGSSVTIVIGSPRSIQLQEKEHHCRYRGHPHNNDVNQIDRAYCQGTSTISASRSVRLNSDTNVRNNSADIIHSQRSRSQENKEASDRCNDSNSSCVPKSSEILPTSSGSSTNVQQPHLRGLKMSLKEQPEITWTNQTMHSPSSLSKQRNSHVHPKLPDYDELAAKFTALKKEHLLRNTLQVSGNT